MSDLDPLLARASDPALFERWLDMARSTGWCERPVRLAGTTQQISPATGEILSSYSTAHEPDGHLLKACGTRRATLCEPCAARYRADAWHLIVAGLRGGKGVPESATTHPMLFLTLTAPSFGPVHSERSKNGAAQICQPKRTPPCQHGKRADCQRTHQSGSTILGDPLCFECFDYRKAIFWNAYVTELWRRSTIRIRRELAKVISVRSSRFKDQARVSYAKVVEYQDRGLVHLHVVVRLDGPSGPIDPPPETITSEQFEKAVVHACQRTHFSYPTTQGVTGEVRWGEQMDIRHVAFDSVAPGTVAAYIAKYATKSTDTFGHLDHRLQGSDLASLDVRSHLKRLVTTAWDLGGRPELEHLKLRRWADTLGFRGHWLTKSRHYSTTLGALRTARVEWSASRGDQTSEELDPIAIKEWQYLGRGWDNPGDELLVRSAGAEAAEARKLAREARLAERAE